MRVYLVHCGFYDTEISDGVYESHTNFFVCAEDFKEAGVKARLLPVFIAKRMHVDGIQEIRAVSGWRIEPVLDKSLEGRTEIVSNKQRDLAPRPQTT